MGTVTIRGEFNFSHGRLVSHGFDTGNITHAQAHDLFLRCGELLIELYGPAERSFSLRSGHDGAGDALAIGNALAAQPRAVRNYPRLQDRESDSELGSTIRIAPMTKRPNQSLSQL